MLKHFNISWMFAILFAATPLVLTAQSGLQKTVNAEVTDSICGPSGSHAETIAKTPGMGNDNASCARKCVTIGAKYVLYDPATHTVYSVDDQQKIAKFAGQKVRATGVLDGNTLKLSNVAPLG